MSESRKNKATQYKNSYNAANYDSLRIIDPKGRKQAIEAFARERGESSTAL